MQKAVKKVGTDILGGLLIITAILLGWLPGPGGIPLLIVGLSLLSVNHKWARRWLDWLKEHGERLAVYLFANQKLVPFWQVTAVLLVSVGGTTVFYAQNKIGAGLGVSAVLFGLFLLWALWRNRQPGS